jgi:hypothetical protein
MQPTPVRDIAEELRGSSAQKHDSIVSNKFFIYNGFHVRDLKGKTLAEQRQIFGCFPNQLFDSFTKEGVPAYQTSMNYMSALAQVFKKELYENGDKGIFQDTNWYSQIRNKVFKKYMGWSQETGKPLIESPDPLTEESLRLLCEYEFKLGTRKGLWVRCYMTVMWTTLGRAAEVSKLTLSNLDYDWANHCLVANLIRTKGAKVSRISGLGLFIRRDTWMHCPVHTIGSHLMQHPMLESESQHGYWFPDLANKNVSTLINNELKAFRNSLPADEAQLNITAHSSRHGSAQAANANPTVNVTWIIERGEWALDRLNTAFEYIFGSARNDRKVARVLSGWKNADYGGIPPSLDIFVEEDIRDRLADLATHLFSQKLSTAIKELLLAVQLMYYQEIKAEYPEHLLVSKIERAAAENGFSAHDLTDLGAQLKQEFRRLNCAFVPIYSDSISENIDKLQASYNELVKTQSEESASLRQQLNVLRLQQSEGMQMLLNEIKELKKLMLNGASDGVGVSESNTMLPRSAALALTRATQNSANVPNTRKRKRKKSETVSNVATVEFPESLKSLKGLTIQSAFFEYIDNQLEHCESSDHKAVLSDLRKVYSFCCDKEPELLNLPKRPVQPGEPYRDWRESVTKEIETRCGRVYKNLRAERGNNMGPTVLACVSAIRKLESEEKKKNKN